MWINTKTNKMNSLKKIFDSGFNIKILKPEPLHVACPITFGLDIGKYRQVLDIETASIDDNKDYIEQKIREILHDTLIKEGL